MAAERIQVVISIVLIGFLLLIVKRITYHLRNPLRKIPGPFWGRFTRLWVLRDAMTKRSHETSEKLHGKYGAVVRLAPDIYSIADLDVARQLYGIRTPFEKAGWYSAFTEPGDVTIFSDRNNKHFAEQKRKFSASYSISGLIRYEPLFDKCLLLLCKRIEEMSRQGSDCNMAKWLRLFAFDAIGQITFGESFGGLETGRDSYGVLRSTAVSSFYGTVVGIIPEYHQWIWKFIPSDTSEKASRSFIQKQISRKRQDFTSSESSMSFVDVWLQRNGMHEEKMTLKDISLGIAANLGAGSDTTSRAICTIIYLLCRNPQVLSKLQLEIDTAMAQQTTQSAIIPYEVARNLPYLQAVIKESLRLYPIVGTIMPRRVPEGGITLAGYFFREGITVGLNPWSTRTNPKYFGEDASLFRPERWLGPVEEVKRNEYYHIPFSIGPRSCLGKNIAMMEILKAVAKMVHSFSFTIKSPIEDMRYHNHMVLNADSFVCRVEVRQPSPSQGSAA